MTVLLATLLVQQSAPSLNEILSHVGKSAGVTIKAEMTSPSVIPIEWKIGRGGKLVSKYPTTVQYNTPTKWTTWMPDRREYAVSDAEPGNPLPSGFELLWPNASAPFQTGPTVETTYGSRPCYSFPLKADNGQAFDLFVDKATKLPYGTRAKANGTTYETVYRSIRFGAIPDSELTFTPPSDARLATPGQRPPDLIKTGTKLSGFEAKDQAGKRHTLASLLKGKKGLVLNFWFSSCTGCVAEMPYLVKLHPDLSKSKIGMIGVNAIDNPDITGRTSKKNKLPYPTLGGTGAKALTKQVSVTAYPVTVVVDQQQRVVDAMLGFDSDRLTKAIKTLQSR